MLNASLRVISVLGSNMLSCDEILKKYEVRR